MRKFNVIGFALLLVCAAVVLGAPQANWAVAPDEVTGFAVIKDGDIIANVELACWGPNWAWFGMGGKADVDENGNRVANVATKIGGNNKPLNLRFQAQQVGANRIVAEYEFAAPEDAAMIGVAFVISPESRYYTGGKAIGVMENGTQKTFTPAFARGEVNGVFKRTMLRSAAGEEVTIDVEPARSVSSDDGARVWLLSDRIRAGEKVKTTLTLTLPAPTKFYARDEDSFITHVTPEWFPYPVGRYGPPVDLSFLNKDAKGNWIPAGAHGFVKVKGDDFVFEDGTPARFWGANITAYAALASPERAEQLAERVARLGMNVVRLHHLDSTWGPCIIDIKHPDGTTQHLDMEDVRRLDKLVFELKKRGIYVILDPWVGRGFRENDGVAAWDKLGSGNFNLHPFIFFDARMQELHKRFLEQVWMHVNEYTGLAYKDDPAFALTELVNEFLFNNNRIGQFEPYRTNFLNLYKQWAAQNGADVNAGEKVITQNYPKDHQRFYIHTMKRFFADMRRYNREKLGLKMPFNASNWTHWPWDIVAQADEDFMDAHHYYGGNRVGPGDGVGGLWTSEDPHFRDGDSPFAPLAALSVFGKPFTISECGNNPPKTYRAAYYPGLAAIACLQGWDAITPYAFSQGGSASERLSPYEMESDPASVAALTAAALIHRRGDAQPAKQLALMLLNEEEQYAIHWQNGGEKMFQKTAQFRAALETHKVGVALGDKAPAGVKAAMTMEPASAFAYKHPTTELRSDTGELWRDWKSGVATINTPRTQAAIGRLGESQRRWTTNDCAFDITTPYATVALSSLTAQPISQSGKLLLTAVARAEMTDQQYNLSMTKIVNNGKPPALAEPVTGTVTLVTNAKKLTAYPIAADGKRGAGIPLTITQGKATLTLKAADRTLFYEIE